MEIGIIIFFFLVAELSYLGCLRLRQNHTGSFIFAHITFQSVEIMVLNLKYPDPNEDLHSKPEPNACALKLPHC